MLPDGSWKDVGPVSAAGVASDVVVEAADVATAMVVVEPGADVGLDGETVGGGAGALDATEVVLSGAAPWLPLLQAAATGATTTNRPHSRRADRAIDIRCERLSGG
jgi:hypothetical protein